MELLIPILIVAGIIAIIYIALDKEKKDGTHPLDTVATPKTFPPLVEKEEVKEEVKEVVVEAPKVEDVPMTLTVDTPPCVVETPPIQQDKPKAKRGRKPAVKNSSRG